MRTIVLGGTGNFGARIVRALRSDSAIDLLVAGRRGVSVLGAEDVRSVALDVDAHDFAQRLLALSPAVVIHFDAFAGATGGMSVSIVGSRTGGGRVRRSWQLVAPAEHGPEIPCMAAVVLARRLAHGEVFHAGAFPCMGYVSLSEFESEFARWRITTRIEEVAA